MRLGILTLILLATLFGSGFWYEHFERVCKVPITYRVGSIDERFGTTKEEIVRIAAQAEQVWEYPLLEELFVYDENSEFPINLVFDERQENANKEREIREDLEAKEGMSESVGAQYEKLITEFRALKKKYEERVVAYERLLESYNTEVTEWNNKGGAPEDVILELKDTEQDLKKEQSSLTTQAKKLDVIVHELNKIGAQGNSLITDYNTIVKNYNEQVKDIHEFTQGDYLPEAINIYQFDSEDELILVLAHEFGHALSLDHVSNEASIMYRAMGTQSLEEGISAEDRAEFNKICKERGPLDTVMSLIGMFSTLLPF